jgi:putative sigma-54 modulation protein
MRVELTGQQVEISPGLRNLVNRKIAKVARVLDNALLSADVVVRKEKAFNVVEVTLHARGERFMHAVGRADTWQAAMSLATAKLLHQTEKVKGLWQERKRRGPAARSVKTPRAARKAVARRTSPVTGSTTAGRPRPAAPARARKQR